MTDYEGPILTVKEGTWEAFGEFARGLRPRRYIFRGHGNSDWKLEPTFDRRFPTNDPRVLEGHLRRFKKEVRGRRGSHPVPLEENDWWALGQHHGLATPLLDWTESPFIALYFAARTALQDSNGTGRMAVYCLDHWCIEFVNEGGPLAKLMTSTSALFQRYSVEIVKPNSDENVRLISQRGLFTRVTRHPEKAWLSVVRKPYNEALEEWIGEGPYGGSPDVLIKYVMPTKDLESCLSYLEAMTIDHSTLFPDLSGAAEVCNRELQRDCDTRRLALNPFDVD